MPPLITEKARVITACRVADSFQANNLLNHYMFAANHIPSDNDDNPAAPDNSEDFQFYQMARQIIFGKKIEADDVTTAIRYYPWTSGTVYAAYDDKDPDLYKKKFYTITQEGSEYSVFKCLFNAKGMPSTFAPKKSETDIADELYRTNDEYIWKLLFSVSQSQFSKFLIGSDWFPCFDNPAAKAAAVRGSLNAIVVEAGGSGYNSYIDGSFRAISLTGNNLIHSIQSDNVLSANTDFYKYCGLYIKAGTGSGQLRQIDEYVVTGSDRRVVLKSEFDVSPDFSSKFEIAPYIEIKGDGTGAEAFVTINSSANSIHSIQMIDIGQEYSVADIQIVANPSTISANSASIRAIISPNGGHGSNIENELFASALVISSTFTGDEGGQFPVVNDYRTTGVILNPQFANSVITVDSTSGFAANQTVKQETGLIATISAVALDGANTIRLKNIQGLVEIGEPIVASNTVNTAIATANVTATDRDLSIFDNRSVYSVEPISPLNEFIIDEKVSQSSSGAYGYLHAVSNNTVYLTGVVGAFSVSDFTVGFEATFVGEESGAVAQITGFNPPDLVKNRGECIYIQTTPPVTRSAEQAERLKILVEF